MQSFLMLLAGFLTYRAAFHRKILGGTIGVSLRIFAVGLLFLGAALTQIPFIQAYNLWTTAYVETGWYFVSFVIGGLLLVASLVIGRGEDYRKIGQIVGGVILFSILLRFAYSKIPLHAHTYYTNLVDYHHGQTLDVTLFSIVLLSVLLSLLHKNVFGKSKIGHIFTMQVVGFCFYFIPTFADFLTDIIPGFNNWYTYTLAGNIFFAGSLLMASVFFYNFGVYLNEFQLA